MKWPLRRNLNPRSFLWISKLLTRLTIVIVSFNVGLIDERPCWAQDEKFLQELRQGKFNPEVVKKSTDYSFILESMMYDIDLNQDGPQEGIMFEQRDGESWMVIYNSQGRKLREFKFFVTGRYAAPVRLHLKALGPQVRGLGIAFKEGENNYTEFANMVRWYFLVMEGANFKYMNLVPGPLMAEEHLDFQKRYYRRGSRLSFEDLNQDGMLDVVVSFRDIKRAYLFRHHTLEPIRMKW